MQKVRRQAIPDFLAATDAEKLEGAFEKIETDEEGSEISARETREREERRAETVEDGGRAVVQVAFFFVVVFLFVSARPQLDEPIREDTVSTVGNGQNYDDETVAFSLISRNEYRHFPVEIIH